MPNKYINIIVLKIPTGWWFSSMTEESNWGLPRNSSNIMVRERLEPSALTNRPRCHLPVLSDHEESLCQPREVRGKYFDFLSFQYMAFQNLTMHYSQFPGWIYNACRSLSFMYWACSQTSSTKWARGNKRLCGRRMLCAKVWHKLCEDHLHSMFNIPAVINGPDFCLQTCIFLNKSVTVMKPKPEVQWFSFPTIS